MKGRLIAIVVTAVVLFLLDFVIHTFILVPSEEMKVAFEGVWHPNGEGPNPAWWLVYELALAYILGMIVLQKPMDAIQGAKSGAIMFFLFALTGVVFWMMFFTVSSMSWGMSELGIGIVLGAIAGWLMVTINNKMGDG